MNRFETGFFRFPNASGALRAPGQAKNGFRKRALGESGFAEENPLERVAHSTPAHPLSKLEYTVDNSAGETPDAR
ncbi:hypothetical protein SAE02_77590 [Skermanella aerolata]|uniref:Uncharacterized protein n=1 Tax=Skermanella aerolata TaxID=393310 RepID=A0A512E4H3_9PROT|nr:hypothetical protein [Skermanella aerolata]KJB89994.1 hypothetical protein N826_08760 [Skermanella aerolata KACC 11604]GEO43611.1 hypothetical protein SAE02_77590 [Skermanella aerolata]